MAIVYQYDTDGFFIGPCDDCGGPMPHGCDSIGPPTAMPDGSPIPDFSRFRKVGPGKFDVVEDHRGRIGHVPGGEAQAITTWGPLPEGWVEGEPEPQPPTLEQARAAKIAEINAGYDSVMGYVQSGYPDREVLSWERQASQARAYRDDPALDIATRAAFVAALAKTKGLTLEEMCSRILRNTESWEPVAAMLTGQRQLMEEAAWAAETVEQVRAIKVGYSV